jgi:integrase
MAQLTRRISGLPQDSENHGRVTNRFPDTREGRRAAGQFAKTLDAVRVVYDVRVRIDGRVVTKTFPTRKAADAWAIQVAHDKLTGIAVDPRSGSEAFRDYAARWLETRRVRGRPLAPKTSDLYRVLLRVHIEPTFGSRQLNAITAEAVRRWHAKVSNESGPMSAAKSYRLLRGILSTAVADGVIALNPCRVRGAGSERSAERPIVGPAVVIELADAIGVRWRAMVLVAGFAGLRMGELIALRRKHVDLKAHSLTVGEQVVTLEGGRRLVTEPKTEAGRRVIALPQLVVDSLAEHMRNQDPGREGPQALLFPAEDGGLLPVTTFYKHWRRARHQVGRDDLHLHDLRHVAGTLAAWTGATEKELMARLGHANPTAARRYQHAARDRDRAIAAGLDAILEGLSDSERAIDAR